MAKRYFSSKGMKVYEANRSPNGTLYFNLDKPYNFSSTTFKPKVDLFIHAAGANENTCLSDPYTSVSQNTIGTIAALDFCVENNIETFIYLSTFHVFGNPSGLIDEKTPPSPFNIYGISHLHAEDYVTMYTRKGLLKGIILRPSNLFGVPDDLSTFKRWSLIPFSFCRDAVIQKAINLKTSGSQMRNFISVFDVCKIIELVIQQPNQYPVIHAAGSETLSVKDFAYTVQKVMKHHFKLDVYVNVPKHNNGDPPPLPFTFKSLYLNSIYRPTDTLDDHIITLCTYLGADSYDK